MNDDGPVVAGGRGRDLEEGAVAGLALDGGVDSLVGLHVVVAPGSTPLSEDHSLVTASLPMPRGDRVLVTGVDGRRVRKSALGLDEDGRDTILAELMTGSEGRTCPVEVEHGSLAVCCCPQAIVPGGPVAVAGCRLLRRCLPRGADERRPRRVPSDSKNLGVL